jgi:site-specific DNA-methyltransferase (adenine-specific)
MACEQNGRKAYCMEFDPKFVDVIIDRWETFTGKKAVLLNDASAADCKKAVTEK